MLYIGNTSTDPGFNLALEQYVFDQLSKTEEFIILWQNDNAVIVGKHQNTLEEVNPAFIKEHDIKVVRRLSGGGAVYHDLGNINFTFISNGPDTTKLDFSRFCIPVVKALKTLGVEAEVSGRNDITIDGKKFSGNAQYMKHGRIMHHGTIMFDSNLEMVEHALKVSMDKITSKGLKSVRSRVTNVRPYINKDISVKEFKKILRDLLFQEYNLKEYHMTEGDLDAVRDIKAGRYDLWEWNYGASPAFQMCKKRRIEGCGQLEIHMDVDKGVIQRVAFFGDYFGSDDTRELEDMLAGCCLEEQALYSFLEDKNINKYFHNITLDAFVKAMVF